MSSAGLLFECTECGECCSNHGQYAHVYLTLAEVRVLAELLETPIRVFRSRYTFVDADGWIQLRGSHERCVFLDPKSLRCTVYSARPIQCRTFPFWRDLVKDGAWTSEARSLCEGVGRGRRYTEAEAEMLMTAMAESDD